MSEEPDAAKCPLCGAANMCGLAAGLDRCWCGEVRVDPVQITKVPPSLRNRVCLCRSCADSLGDDVVELRLLRVLEAGDTESRTTETRFLAQAPEIRYAIHRRSDGLRVGRIHLRVTNDQTFLRTLGHGGYAMDEEHRGKGYAQRAIRLILALARHYMIAPLWILIEPDNVASQRAVERAGLRLLDEIATEPEARALGLGPRMCRYVIDQP